MNLDRPAGNSAKTEPNRIGAYQGRRPRLLCFFLTGGRTGSEIALYNLITHADRQTIEIAATCYKGGELMKALPEDIRYFDYSTSPARTIAVASSVRRTTGRALDSVYHRAYYLLHGGPPPLREATSLERIMQIQETFRPDLWYINTVVQPLVLDLAHSLNIPCIVHSHELEGMLIGLTPESVARMVSYPKLIIASSHAAAAMMTGLGRREQIEVCYPTIDISRIKSTQGAAAEVRAHLGVPSDVFLWAMSGAQDPNKNPLLFVEVARSMIALDPRVHFMWIGGLETGYSIYVKEYAKSLGLDRHISWVPAQGEGYYDFLNAIDGFVLTSSRESFSLVTVEAAALGKPVVAFDCGGINEIFRPAMGILIENSRSASDLVSAMHKVMRGEAGFDAQTARERAASFDVSVGVKPWENLVHKCLNVSQHSADHS